MYIYKKDEWQLISFNTLQGLEQMISAFDSQFDRNVIVFNAPLGSTKACFHFEKPDCEAETLDALYSDLESADDEVINELIKNRKTIAVNINYLINRYDTSDDDLWDRMITFLNEQSDFHKKKKSVNLLGLGDVGSMLTIGLKLLGGECISEIGIFDLNDNQKSRWEMELNQITTNSKIRVKAITYDQLFDSDVFVFCASKYVPKVGENVEDVRMVQFNENSKIVSLYAKEARNSNFKGIFAVVSDPVDLLCLSVFDASNRDDAGEMDYKGLFPEQIRGYGLGVMDGRAKYYSRLMNLSYDEKGRVFGPHGSALVVSADVGQEDDVYSLQLTEQVIHANLDVRALGFKPFIAPALSSGADAIVSTLNGQWHYSATFVGGIYWGTRNRLSTYGTEYEALTLGSDLLNRVRQSYHNLEEAWAQLK
ncbi:MAG: lactate dehydrogenase [Bacillota bacterium]|nr:lactate dehydrogenase [Bacillota bacterium]